MNQYSEEWFTYFLKEVPAEKTRDEVAFLARQFSPGSNLLDLCCGNGRHAIPLATMNYDVTGIDIQDLKWPPSKANFIQGDVRNHYLQSKSAHGIYCLWQSFGFYSTLENIRLLTDWRRALKDDGKLVLDIYNRDFFKGKDGARATGKVIESKRMKGNRLQVHLQYPGGKQDVFEWELFTQAELKKAADQAGFELLFSCSGFQENQPVSENEPRMQLVFKPK